MVLHDLLEAECLTKASLGRPELFMHGQRCQQVER